MCSSREAGLTEINQANVSSVSHHFSGHILADSCIIRSQFSEYDKPEHNRSAMLHRRQI
jgi:hypothetical protein